MKRLTYLLISLIAVACSEQGEKGNQQFTWEHVQKQGEGSVTLAYVPSDGFSYENEEGRLTGVTIELFRDFIDYVNVEYGVSVSIKYEPIESFTDFYERVRDGNGGVFGVANVTITEERQEELRFSPSYMTNIATLITHSDTAELTEMDEIPQRFAGLDALAFEGTLHEERLRAIADHYDLDIAIDFAHSNNEIIEQVAEENRYFAYVDIYNYWRAAQNGTPLQRHAAGDEASEQFGVIMPLNNDWYPLMDEFFEAEGGYVQSDRYRYLMETHLGTELADLLLDPGTVQN